MFGPSDGWDMLTPDQQNDILDAETEAAPESREDVAVAEVLLPFVRKVCTCHLFSSDREPHNRGCETLAQARKAAEALAPVTAERERAAAVEAWDEGALRVADLLGCGFDNDHLACLNPYRADRRAER